MTVANDLLRASATPPGKVHDMLLASGKAKLEAATRPPAPGEPGSGAYLLRKANSTGPKGK